MSCLVAAVVSDRPSPGDGTATFSDVDGLCEINGERVVTVVSSGDGGHRRYRGTLDGDVSRLIADYLFMRIFYSSTLCISSTLVPVVSDRPSPGDGTATFSDVDG